MKAAAAPAHKGRPPRARSGSPRPRPPSSPRRSAGLHSRGHTHGGGVALRGSGPLASAPASASSRLLGWAVTACCPRPRLGPLRLRLCRLPGARGWTPPSSGSPRPFPLPHRKAKTIGAAQAREGNGKQEGRGRREVTLASVSGLPGPPPGSQGACAERGRGVAGPPSLRSDLEKAVPRILFSATWTSVQQQLFVFEVSTGDTDTGRPGQSGGQYYTPGC